MTVDGDGDAARHALSHRGRPARALIAWLGGSGV